MSLEKADLAHFDFELFVAGDAPNSARALFNLRALCESHIPNRYTIEIIDVFQEPMRAMEEKVFMTPTLLRTAPVPRCRIVGTLSHAANVLDALGLDAQAA